MGIILNLAGFEGLLTSHSLHASRIPPVVIKTKNIFADIQLRAGKSYGRSLFWLIFHNRKTHAI